MKRSEAEAMIERSDMRAADRAVFLCLMRRADNQTCEIPARFAPSLESIARRTGSHVSTIKRSLTHLELHRWIQRERTKGGRKRKDGRTYRTGYLIIPNGTPLPCDCTKQAPGKPSKQARDEPVSSTKQAHSEPPNRRIEVLVSAGQAPDCTEGLRCRGEVGREGASARLINSQGKGLPAYDPERGPCTRCRQPCVRYGIRGRPLCPVCMIGARLRASKHSQWSQDIPAWAA